MQHQRGNKTWTRNKARRYKYDWASEVEVGQFLYAFVRMVKPESVLEIGTFEGDAAIAIGNGLSDNKLGHLTTLDIKNFGQKENIHNKHLDRYVDCLITDGNYSTEFLNTAKCDLIFIDDGHSYSEALRDLCIADSICISKGYILGHDVLSHEGVARAYEEFLGTHKNYDSIILESFNGLFMLRKND